MSLLTKNAFLEEINKQYVMLAKAKGLAPRQVLYGHVFRNAMLVIISSFPAAFVGMFFTGALMIEIIFSLNGLGLLGYQANHSKRLSSGVWCFVFIYLNWFAR